MFIRRIPNTQVKHAFKKQIRVRMLYLAWEDLKEVLLFFIILRLSPSNEQYLVHLYLLFTQKKKKHFSSFLHDKFE